MKVSQILAPFLFILFGSCELIAPNTSTGSGAQVTNLRNIKVICEQEDIPVCFGSDNTYKAIVRYSKEPCKDLDHLSLYFAQGSAELLCSSDECNALVKDFEFVDTSYVDSGEYTLLSFIDKNQNENLDIDEPFFCAEGVELNASKRLVNIDVKILRLYGR